MSLRWTTLSNGHWLLVYFRRISALTSTTWTPILSWWSTACFQGNREQWMDINWSIFRMVKEEQAENELQHIQQLMTQGEVPSTVAVSFLVFARAKTGFSKSTKESTQTVNHWSWRSKWCRMRSRKPHRDSHGCTNGKTEIAIPVTRLMAWRLLYKV